jgi:acyl-CoA thioesterase FadM
MDEIGGWVVLVKCKTGGVTTDMSIKYLRPILITNGSIKIKGWLKEFKGNLATVESEILDSNGEVCASGEIRYFCYPEPIARRKLYYPGVEAFY